MAIMVYNNNKNRSTRLGSPGNMSKILRKIVDRNFVSTGMVVDNHKEFQDLANYPEFQCQTKMMLTTCLEIIINILWGSLKQLLQHGL